MRPADLPAQKQIKESKVKKEAVKKLEKYDNLDEFGHNLVTKPKIEEAEESRVVNITS